MIFKKKVNGSRADTPHYIHKTATDTITTLPADIYANDTTATVGLEGNTVQSDNPIMPQGTGERTGNLYFKKLAEANVSDKGMITAVTGFDLYIAEVEQGVRYSGTGYIYAFFENIPEMGSSSFNGSRVVDSFRDIVSPINGFIAVRHTNTAQNAMCNTGSTALPYEPYGYKIPISSANTTTPVYLGEVETTRRVKKFVLTGQEGGVWSLNVTIRNGNAYYNPSIFTGYKANVGMGYCTHYPLATAITAAIGVFFGGNINFITDFSEGIDTADKWKSYLQQQYAAGIPVCVWYVLANEETGIVNEPLMKIGDYADSISGISIPTIAGANTLSVDTTLQPSEVTVNYKGWHPVLNVHECTNGAWT